MLVPLANLTLDTIEGQAIEIEDDPYEYDDDYVKESTAEAPIYQNDEQILIEGERTVNPRVIVLVMYNCYCVNRSDICGFFSLGKKVLVLSFFSPVIIERIYELRYFSRVGLPGM